MNLLIEDSEDYEQGFKHGYDDAREENPYAFRTVSLEDQSLIDSRGNKVADDMVTYGMGYIEGYMQAVYDAT